MLVNLFIFYLVISVGSCQKCISCEKEINEMFGVAKSVLAGLDPLELTDIKICRTLKISNIKSVQTPKNPCLIDLKQGNFEQHIDIGFDEIHINCTLKPLMEIAEVIHLPGPLTTLLNLLPKGEGSKPSTILADWKPVHLKLKLNLNFDKDEFSVKESVISDIQFDNLMLHCKGENVMNVCEKATELPLVRKLIGFIAQHILQKVMILLFENETLNEVVTLLNCGEKD